MALRCLVAPFPFPFFLPHGDREEGRRCGDSRLSNLPGYASKVCDHVHKYVTRGGAKFSILIFSSYISIRRSTFLFFFFFFLQLVYGFFERGM